MSMPYTDFPGAKDARPFEQQSEVRTWTTDVLRNPVEWIGEVTAEVWVSSTAKDTDFILRVTDVYPDGRSILLMDYPQRALPRRLRAAATPHPRRTGEARVAHRLHERHRQQEPPHPRHHRQQRRALLRAEQSDRRQTAGRLDENHAVHNQHHLARRRAPLAHHHADAARKVAQGFSPQERDCIP